MQALGAGAISSGLKTRLYEKWLSEQITSSLEKKLGKSLKALFKYLIFFFLSEISSI